LFVGKVDLVQGALTALAVEATVAGVVAATGLAAEAEGAGAGVRATLAEGTDADALGRLAEAGF
jgi:hypothetical protein